MSLYTHIQARLQARPKTWLITGVAGFIGSNLLETLLQLDQRVVGLDNFSTGYQHNLDEVQTLVTPEQWANFHLIKGDICHLDVCRSAMHFSPSPSSLAAEDGRTWAVDYVLHQVLGAESRLLDDTINTINMLIAARDAGVKRFICAAGKSTHSDDPNLSKVTDNIGKPLSAHAVTKLVNELYAEVFGCIYGLKTIGLRYCSIFGRRQDPNGPYASVITRWIDALVKGEQVYINGTEETSCDFCYIDNVRQINLLAAISRNPQAVNQVYNVTVGDHTDLNDLFMLLRDGLATKHPTLESFQPVYRDFRPGDVKHSQADINKAHRFLGYEPTHTIRQGLDEALGWYVSNV